MNQHNIIFKNYICIQNGLGIIRYAEWSGIFILVRYLMSCWFRSIDAVPAVGDPMSHIKVSSTCVHLSFIYSSSLFYGILSYIPYSWSLFKEISFNAFWYSWYIFFAPRIYTLLLLFRQLPMYHWLHSHASYTMPCLLIYGCSGNNIRIFIGKAK